MTNLENEKKKDESCGRHGCCHGARHWLWKIPIVIVLFIGVRAALVQVLWNTLVPELFHGPQLLYLQALGLIVLAKLLVGFGGHRPFGHRWHGRHWRHARALKARWETLSPEEREKL